MLKPYKYSGYPQLILTIKIETNDNQLFSKTEPLLASAAELAYHTVNCSALNAEELRRQNGLEVINEQNFPIEILHSFFGYFASKMLVILGPLTPKNELVKT